MTSPEFKTVYGGTLDGASGLSPVAHVWTQDAQPWIALPEPHLKYAQNPPDMAAIEQAWKDRDSINS